MELKLIRNIDFRRTIRRLLLFCCGLLFWIYSIINQKYIADYHGAVSVRYRDPVITKQQIEDILEGMISREDHNIPEVTLWQREEDTVVRNHAMDSSVSLALITVAGDMSKVYPGPVLTGGALSREDQAGCIIDENTAYQLFYSEDVLGMKLDLEGKEYIIRGILKSESHNTMIIQAEDTLLGDREAKQYSCMELTFSDNRNAKPLAEQFIFTYGLGEPSAYIDGYLYRMLTEHLIHIPLWFCALWIIALFVRKIYSLKASPVLSLMGWAGVILISTLFIKLTDFYFYIPGSMIPNRWSDFDFWVSLLKKLTASLKEKEGILRYYKEAELRQRFFYSAAGAALAAIAEGLIIKDIRGCKNITELK